MAVPPIQRSQDQAGQSAAWLLDVVLGLLVVAALPLAIVAVPNTLSVVARLLPADIDRVALMRTHGLALPALMLTVPLAAAALRRFRPAHLVVAGLALLAVADAAGGYAGSELVIGVVRVLHGVGAGLVVPASLAAVWHRRPALRGVWAGVFALSLLAAQGLALWPLDAVTDWRVTLQPYPMVTGVALGLGAAYLVVSALSGRPETAGPSAAETRRLLLAAVPAAGIAAVAIATASQGWGATLVIVLAGLAVVALLALASTGTAVSRVSSYAMVAVGVVLLPSAAQVTLVEMGGLGGPGLRGLWVPFGVAGLLAVAAGVAVRLSPGGGRWLTSLGLLAMVVGLCSVRVVVPAPDGLVLAVPFTLLAVGASVALTSALGQVRAGGALFGLSLCFAGVLAGYLLGTGVQMAMLGGVRSAQELVDGFVGALHWWALVGGFLVVALIVLAALLARNAEPDGDVDDDPDDDLAGDLDGSYGADTGQGSRPETAGFEAAGYQAYGASYGEAGHEAYGGGPAGGAETLPPVPSAGAFGRATGGEQEADEQATSTGPMPAVPPQAGSPEDDTPR
uniref:hypothetical protein n=1 Tax=Nonomuraea pusilla TaxID=46177 RepID=UPI0006E2EAA6|nr:hypothetical protein [Nonomuraea pusilla]